MIDIEMPDASSDKTGNNLEMMDIEKFTVQKAVSGSADISTTDATDSQLEATVEKAVSGSAFEFEEDPNTPTTDKPNPGPTARRFGEQELGDLPEARGMEGSTDLPEAKGMEGSTVRNGSTAEFGVHEKVTDVQTKQMDVKETAVTVNAAVVRPSTLLPHDSDLAPASNVGLPAFLPLKVVEYLRGVSTMEGWQNLLDEYFTFEKGSPLTGVCLYLTIPSDTY